MHTISAQKKIVLCRRNWLTAVLSMLFFVGASVSYAAIHNDDSRHPVHPLAHSSICKWVMDSKGGLKKAVHTAPPPLASAVSPVALPKARVVSHITLPCPRLRQLCMIDQLQERAPPLRPSYR